MAQQNKKISFFGLGLMGSAMVKHLIARKDFTVTVWNRSSEKAAPFKELGAHVASTPESAITNSDILLTMLWDFQSIKDTLYIGTEKANLLKGKTIIQLSTISPDENLKLHECVTQVGGIFVESPVLGTVNAVESKNLQCLVGTTPEKFTEIEDILKSFGPVVRHIGAVGQGSKLKLAFNHMVISQVVTFATSLAMVVKQDLPLDTFMEILRNAAFYSKYFDMKLPAMTSRNFGNAYFYTTGALKDATLIVGECKKLGIDTSAVEAARELLEKAAQKYPDADFASLYNIINPPEN